jgi:plastocyanin
MLCNTDNTTQIIFMEVFIMRKLFFGSTSAVTGLLLIFAMGCSKNSSSPTSPQYGSNQSNSGTPSSNTVTTVGNVFTPSALTVAVHTTIIWDNNSAITHTSTSDNGKWNTGNISPGSSAQTIFDSTGTYHYHCNIHPGMTGTITVQ